MRLNSFGFNFEYYSKSIRKDSLFPSHQLRIYIMLQTSKVPGFRCAGENEVGDFGGAPRL